MSASPIGTAWDERFRKAEWAYGKEPNHYLHSNRPRLAPGGRALAVGDGEGRNGVWLAGEGFAVTAVDASGVGLEKAERLARERKVSQHYNAELSTLEDWNWPREHFDLVAAIFIHYPSVQRPLMHARYVDALRPGGMLLMESFGKQQLSYGTGGPKDADLLYSRGELAGDFAALEILELVELEAELQEGPFHSGRSALVRLLARKRT